MRAPLFEKFNNLAVPTSSGPRKRRGPGRIVGPIRLSAAGQEKFDHRFPAKLRGPAERCGADVFVAGMKVGTMIEKPSGLFHVPASCQVMQRRSVEPVARISVHAVLEEQFVQLARFRSHRPRWKIDALWQIGLIAQHQADEAFASLAGRVGQRLGIIGQRGIGREGRRRSENIAAVSE